MKRPTTYGMAAMQSFVMAVFDVAGDDRQLIDALCGDYRGKRQRSLSAARIQLTKQLRALDPPLTLEDIARLMGVTHSALCHALKKDRREVDKQTQSATV